MGDGREAHGRFPPVISNNKVIPNDQTSLSKGEYVSPRFELPVSTSGLMYVVVPKRKDLLSTLCVASPKSDRKTFNNLSPAT